MDVKGGRKTSRNPEMKSIIYLSTVLWTTFSSVLDLVSLSGPITEEWKGGAFCGIFGLNLSSQVTNQTAHIPVDYTTVDFMNFNVDLSYICLFCLFSTLVTISTATTPHFCAMDVC